MDSVRRPGARKETMNKKDQPFFGIGWAVESAQREKL